MLWLWPEGKIPHQSLFRHHFDLLFEVLVVSKQQVQEFFDARRQALTNPETFQNARRVLITSDKTEVLAHFETRLQVRDEEERASTIEGLALLYGPEAADTIVRWINDSSWIVRCVVCGCLHDHGDVRAAAASWID
ncbi:MAG: HEAT repeat domain-containing protein [Planctomycetes bacterium]|nr:HEAT repeat domain-containing protein [Planctomycetota bacterium]